MKLSQSFEDYLEAIYILEIEDQKVKSVTISRMLNVTKPAVTKATNELLKANLIEKTPYSELKLTEAGRLLAKGVYHRHIIIREYLIKKLGVPKPIAEKDCCMIEHVISPETLECIEQKLK